MRIKVHPEDFIVKERIDLQFDDAGAYSVYELTKRDITTVDAISAIKKKLNAKGITSAGMKDKKGVCTQFIAVKGRYQNNIRDDRFSAVFKGYVQKPIMPGDLKENEF